MTLHRLALLLPILLLQAAILPRHSTAARPDPFVVGIVASDDDALESPSPRDRELTVLQVEEMTRRAVDLIGGMASVVSDSARLIVIKPNIGVDKKSGSGVVTDARVVRAVAILVHEVAPVEAGHALQESQRRLHQRVGGTRGLRDGAPTLDVAGSIGARSRLFA
jgi:hypothetical protein